MLKKSLSANKIISIIISLSLLSALLIGCGEKNAESEPPAAVTFTDALGRNVTVAENPKRVAALLGSFADAWTLAGGTLCAAAEDAWDDFGLQLKDAVNLGGAHSPSLESLISSDLDFVIASASTSADIEMKESLQNAGITVAYFDVDCFEDYLNMLKIFTDITGREDLYQKNGLEVQKQIEEIKARFAAAGLSEEKKTLLLLRTSASSVKAKDSEGTVLGEMLKDLGCVNIADSDKSLLENLSVESVIRDEPYRIFTVTMGDDTAAATENLKRMMEENPAWGKLEAVRQNRLHVMDRKLFNLKPNANWAKAYEELTEILLG